MIEVSKIFVNQPARLAFQRRPATETSKIVDVVVSHAISHPEVAFRLVSDEKTILEVPAVEEMEDRLYDVLGRQAGKMIKISSPEIRMHPEKSMVRLDFNSRHNQRKRR